MIVSWHGELTVKIISHGTSLVVNPHAQVNGLASFRSKANIIILSNPANPDMSNLKGIQGNPVLLDQPGEYSINNVTVFARGWRDNQNNEQTIHRWNIEGMTLLYLGLLNRQLEQIELQELEKTNIDILFVPIGGLNTINTVQALEIVSLIEPHIVIPINFKLAGSTANLESVDQFASEMGVSPRQKQDKLSIAPNKINREITHTIILNP